jgi:hypothetical protein
MVGVGVALAVVRCGARQWAQLLARGGQLQEVSLEVSRVRLAGVEVEVEAV